MTYSSSLADDLSALILDTSVLINLHSSTYGSRILAALPNKILVPEIVAAELEHETSKTFVQELASSGKARLVTLNESEYEMFATLVSGHHSLGDGEAATIAIAACRRHLPVIDEGKGRLRAQAHWPRIQPPAWSLDLFRHPEVVAALGKAESVDALHLALRNGRMRVHDDHCDHVVSLIGAKRALECNSLPAYKRRRLQWRQLVGF